jgi:alpha-tubulin suppressor-like RCC1 family protein
VDSVRVISVACGDAHMVCAGDGGGLFGWGANSEGQCGLGFKSPQVLRCERVRGLDAVAWVAAGSAHTVAMTAEGQIFCWGRDYEGQCGGGTGGGGAVLQPREAKGGQWNISEDTEGIEGLCGVWAGGRQSVAVWDGVLYSWGCGGEGRLGLPPPLVLSGHAASLTLY